jgi:hypothetical protein
MALTVALGPLAILVLAMNLRFSGRWKWLLWALFGANGAILVLIFLIFAVSFRTVYLAGPSKGFESYSESLLAFQRGNENAVLTFDAMRPPSHLQSWHSVPQAQAEERNGSASFGRHTGRS